MADVKESESDEKVLERLDNELDKMVDQLGGTEMDYDPAIAAAAVEATQHPEEFHNK
ncbi:MAG TPA: hypothetical protein VMT64_13465 [Candidatus Binataceae bacterium]|nr:hypothetical protein [Candidatus Binataceae bacterium]